MQLSDLLAQNFPLLHAVGRAAAEPPRIVDFTFGPEDAPKVTLVGKGWPLYELRGVSLSLEEIFLELTTEDSASPN